MFSLNPDPVPLKPYIVITEQPCKSLRYRYECENRPGTVEGISSTRENKTRVTIQVVGYEGPAVVLVSCVTAEEPYQPHPHHLIGQNCKKGVCTFKTSFSRGVSVTFPKLAVQCVRRKDAKEALKMRMQENIDPFRTRYKHLDNIKSIDLHLVRLCFQVFLQPNTAGQYTTELDPVVSDPILNEKTIPKPLIYKLSQCSCFADGDKAEIILLCTKIVKSDIKIRFFEAVKDQITWEAFGDFTPSHIYNHTAICFKPPPYYNKDITNPVTVFVQLQRPSDGMVSKAVPFQYLPLEAKPGALKRKREKQDRIQFYDQLFGGSSSKKLEVETRVSQDWNWNTMNDLSRQSSVASNWSQSVQTPEVFMGFQQPQMTFTNQITNPQVLEVDGLDTAQGVNRLLNIDDGQHLELQPIHLSSGELEMPSVNRLSETLQGNLSLSDLLI